MTLQVDAQLTEEPVHVAQMIAALRPNGATHVFIGAVRRDGADDSAVHTLLVDHHPVYSRVQVQTVAESVARNGGITQLMVHHRIGEIPVDDVIVAVAAVANHRAEAKRAVEAVMDGLKGYVWLWKQERRITGSRWVSGLRPRAGVSSSDRPERDRQN